MMKKDILEEFAAISSNLLQKIATEEKENITLAAKKQPKPSWMGKKSIFSDVPTPPFLLKMYFTVPAPPPSGSLSGARV